MEKWVRKTKEKREQTPALQRMLLNTGLGDQAHHIVVRHVVERADILYLKPLAQILRGNEARFAVGQVAPCLFPKLHKRGMRQPDNMGFAIDKKLAVNRVCMSRCDAIPHMREAALIRLPSQFGSHFKGADELAHRTGIREYWACCHAISLAHCSF